MLDPLGGFANRSPQLVVEGNGVVHGLGAGLGRLGRLLGNGGGFAGGAADLLDRLGALQGELAGVLELGGLGLGSLRQSGDHPFRVLGQAVDPI